MGDEVIQNLLECLRTAGVNGKARQCEDGLPEKPGVEPGESGSDGLPSVPVPDEDISAMYELVVKADDARNGLQSGVVTPLDH